MASSDQVRRTSQRCAVLMKMLDELKQQAQRNPENEKWSSFGITDLDDKKKDAANKIDCMFEELVGLVEHLAILDMTSSFELAARARISNYVGAIRDAGDKRAKADKLPQHSTGIIRSAQSYESLASIVDFLNRRIDPELASGLKQVGKSRNKFAHGTNIKFSPEIKKSHTEELFIQALDVL